MVADVIGSAVEGFTDRKVDLLLKLLHAIQDNLRRELGDD